jgi:hypothetical protein
VVLDATWLDPERREAARSLAAQLHAHVHEICCDVDTEAAAARILARAAAGGDASDAPPEVLARLGQQPRAPWTEAQHLDTSRPASAVIEDAVSLVRPDRAHAPSGA